MPPLAIAGVAVAGSVAGSLISANAQNNAANAQLSATQQQLAFAQQAQQQQIADRTTAVGYAQQFGGMSASEYSSIQNIIGTQGQALTASLASVNQQQQALDAVDPQVKAAGSSLLNLLNGQASSMLAPAQAQLAQQRQALVSQLESTLGPGYATSSAGIQALTQFDQQSALTQSQIQQSAIGQATQTYSTLFGQQQSGFASIGSQTQSAFGAAQQANESVFNANNSIQNRLDNSVLSAFSGNSPNYGLPVQAQGNVAAVSGLPYQGAGTIGAAVSGLSSGLGQVAGQQYGQQTQMSQINSLLASPGASSTTQMGIPLSQQISSVPTTYTSQFLTGGSQ